jgi:hypothetical protein
MAILEMGFKLFIVDVSIKKKAPPNLYSWEVT